MRAWHCVILAAGLLPAAAFAQPPSPIDATRDAFPGAFPAASSGISAGLALADRWLADEPGFNPAFAPRRAISLSPVVQRVSRQDLSAANRSFTDQTGYIDLAGAWAAWSFPSVALAAYVQQPELRLEDNAYTLGLGLVPGPSAAITSGTATRDLRVGLAASFGSSTWRAGVAGDWERHSENFTYHEESGSPGAGDQSADFSGSGIGATAGAHLGWNWAARACELGAAVRHRPELKLEGTQQQTLVSGSSTAAIRATRSAGWEGGVSARVALSEQFRVLASVGGTSTEDWTGFGISRGHENEWKVAGEFHDARDPWTVRFGGGSERELGVPEPDAGVFAIGLGWDLGGYRLDFGITHRTLTRSGHPNSSDDRALATFTLH